MILHLLLSESIISAWAVWKFASKFKEVLRSNRKSTQMSVKIADFKSYASYGMQSKSPIFSVCCISPV